MPAPPTPTPQQQTVNKTSLPPTSQPFVELNAGTIQLPWYRMLLDLFRKTGSGFSTTTSMVYLQYNAPNLQAFDVNGNLIGNVTFTP